MLKVTLLIFVLVGVATNNVHAFTCYECNDYAQCKDAKPEDLSQVTCDNMYIGEEHYYCISRLIDEDEFVEKSCAFASKEKRLIDICEDDKEEGGKCYFCKEDLCNADF